MRTVLLLAVKDLRLLMRDRIGAFFTFAFPVLYALLFGLMFSGSGADAVDLAVVDRDRTAGSHGFIDRLTATPAVAVHLAPDEASGAELVRTGRAAALLVLPEGFGDPIGAMLSVRPLVLSGVVDPSRKAEAAVVQGVAQGLLLEHAAAALSDPESARATLDRVRATIDPADGERLEAIASLSAGFDGLARLSGSLPIAPRLELAQLSSAERSVPPSAFSLTFAQGAAWGLMACALGSSLSLVGERSRGTLTRLTLAPVGRWQILSGKALACFATSLAMMVVLTLVVHLPFFGVRPVSYGLLAAAVLSSCAAFVGVMMLIASFGRTVAAVEGFGRSVLLVLALMGGAAVPVFFMPGWMRAAAAVSPFRWSIEAIDGAVWRGLSPSDMLVPCGVLLAIGLAGCAGGVAMFRFARGVAAGA
jgi:ABC-2 type transport system permease protein